MMIDKKCIMILSYYDMNNKYGYSMKVVVELPPKNKIFTSHMSSKS